MEECIICNTVTLLQELQCKHKYCILCVKGLINTTPKCPICRAVITRITPIATTIPTNKYTRLWLYQGRTGGWWVFDDELQEKLSSAKCTSFSWIVSSQRMHFDVVNMVQENLDTGTVRYIKRIDISDVSKYEIRGVSGVPLKPYQ